MEVQAAAVLRARPVKNAADADPVPGHLVGTAVTDTFYHRPSSPDAYGRPAVKEIQPDRIPSPQDRADQLSFIRNQLAVVLSGAIDELGARDRLSKAGGGKQRTGGKQQDERQKFFF